MLKLMNMKRPDIFVTKQKNLNSVAQPNWGYICLRFWGSSSSDFQIQNSVISRLYQYQEI